MFQVYFLGFIALSLFFIFGSNFCLKKAKEADPKAYKDMQDIADKFANKDKE